MYIIKNALKNIVRNRGRNILIGVILLGIITSTVVAFSINSTTTGIIDNYKDRFGTEVTIVRNMKKVQEMMSNGQASIRFEDISPAQYLSFGNSEYVKDTMFTSTLSGISKLTAVDQDLANSETSLEVYMDDDGNIVSPSFKLIGNSNLEALEEFKSNQRKIIDGRIYNEKDECVISKDLADLNGIKVGDTIEISLPTDMTKTPIKLKVSGVYLDITSEYAEFSIKNPLGNRRNEILCNFELVNENALFLDVQAKYFLTSPEVFDAFATELTAKGLPEIYEPSNDTSSYNKIVGPVEGLASITLLFIGVVLVLGAIILVLLNTISIRERKYEIGVLRAIGMKKGKVAMGLITESLVITLVCLVVGLGIGSAIAKPVSDSMMQKQVEIYTSNEETSNYWASMGTNSQNNEDIISEIDVIVDGSTIAKVAGLSLILVLFSSLVGVIYITRYEPVKILTERG